MSDQQIGIPGLGNTIGFSTNGGTTFITLPNLQDIDGVPSELGTIESTGLGSVAEEVLPTIFKEGAIVAKILYLPTKTEHALLWTKYRAKEFMSWKLTFPNPVGLGATNPDTPQGYSCTALITSFNHTGFEVEGKIEAAIAIKPSGPLVKLP